MVDCMIGWLNDGMKGGSMLGCLNEYGLMHG